MYSLTGCVIDSHQPPPKGYKCNCYRDCGFGEDCKVCSGYAEACRTDDECGCQGCFEKECCYKRYAEYEGDCKGYEDEGPGTVLMNIPWRAL